MAARLEAEKFTGSYNFGLWRLKIKALLIQQGLSAALEEKEDDQKAEEVLDEKAKAKLVEIYAKEHSVVILCLCDKINDEDKAIMLLNALSKNYDHLRDAMVYGREKTITFTEFQSALRAKELQKGSAKPQEAVPESLHVKKFKKGKFKKKADDGKASTSDQRETRSVLLGNNHVCNVRGIGTVKLKMHDGSIKLLSEVRYIPEIKRNLVSLVLLEVKDFTFISTGGKMEVKKGHHTVMVAERRNNLYYLLVEAITGDSNSAMIDDLKLRRDRLGHPAEGTHYSDSPLEYAHLDLWGPTPVNTLGGGMCLRTDNGLEYLSKEFDMFCKKNGIRRHRTVPGIPQQNGVAECMNRTIMEQVRCMLFASGLSKKFWEEAVSTAAYLINKCPSTSLKGDTPDFRWYRDHGDYSKVKLLGASVLHMSSKVS
ncbi:uncharacterized protein LOC121784097 [Salvia splendens]|uniref:uncharacterized protein LOC121784097 n=1 Tax=Salvia splendens TaxID=180675 RepID=UPI001C25B721|nr:uncharacterized protein LOC121784097 [Salvia splendens]